jgi:Kef-type K+ transport system membrane component KefB
MYFALGFVAIGLLLVGMAISASVMKRLPISTSMLYMAAGVGLGPAGLGLIRLDPANSSGFLERFAEIAVIV